jgi:pyruvate,water dikinase
MDIFFARLQDLDACIRKDADSEWKKLGESIQLEKQDYLKDQGRTPDWVLGEKRKDESMGEELGGLPGSPGQAEGPVFLVLAPDDFARFPKGSVLVARTTNPTWTPLFYAAAAVITESGGPLSHGAVTARETGIPAVMSVRLCLAVLKNGDRVHVDGTRGRVRIIRRVE